MGATRTIARAFAIGFTASILFGCGGTNLSGTASIGSLPDTTTAGQAHSWMKADAAKQDLVYVSDGQVSAYVLTYPEGERVGRINGLTGAGAMCSDADGNVFMVNEGLPGPTKFPLSILKFAHGGTTPIGKLNDGAYVPSGCSVDPTTGDLAVANWSDQPSLGSVAIYKHGQGKPAFSAMGRNFYYCTYDNEGNLFLSGGGGTFTLWEIPKGSNTAHNISFSAPNSFPAAIQWDGKYLAIRHLTESEHGPTEVYRVKISGSTAAVVKTMKFRTRFKANPLVGLQFWLQGDTLIQPNTDWHNIDKLDLWNYPRGGQPRKVITDFSALNMVGVTVSVARSR
jgi:hypothetical protein